MLGIVKNSWTIFYIHLPVTHFTNWERAHCCFEHSFFMEFAATNSTAGALFQEVVKNQKHAMRALHPRGRGGCTRDTQKPPTPPTVSALRVANLWKISCHSQTALIWPSENLINSRWRKHVALAHLYFHHPPAAPHLHQREKESRPTESSP